MKSKTLICIIMLLLPVYLVKAQNQNDALRYSREQFGGTARAVSMGGAFGALGGDLSVLSYNPAGIAMFRQNEIAITPTIFYNNTESSYLATGATDSDNKYNFNVNNVGIVGTFGVDESKNGWANVNFGFSYNKMNNFHRNIAIQGRNYSNSLMDYWVDDANADNWNEFYNDLAWETFLINYDSIDNVYWSDITDDPIFDDVNYGQVQKESDEISGSLGESVFSFGANYQHKLYIGVSLGIRSFTYNRNATYSEIDVDDRIYYWNSFTLNENLDASGTGYNFKIGMIYKPLDWLRIGGAIHTPTFWDVDETFSTSLDREFDVADEDANYAESPVSDFTYSLTTPFKAMGSLGLVIKKNAILSVDYEFVDYSQMRLRSEKAGEFDDANDVIDNDFTSTYNLRAGAEYRLGMLSLRAGYGLYGSPYANDNYGKDASISVISGGVGINSGNFFVDFAYSRSMKEYTKYLYDTYTNEAKVGADMESVSARMLLTLGMRF